MGIKKENIAQLKDSTDIVDIIGDYMELRKAGANYKGNCPFHGEKTPSFTVSPSKQIYHCFGCQVSGDVFEFVKEFNKLSFIEAVEAVASRSNFTLQYDENHGKRKDFSRVLDAVNLYYVKSLRDSDREYLKGRGLTAKTMDEWQIGWAGRSPDQKKFFDGALLPKDELVELGLLRSGERGTYAQFTERIMFPIHNHMGKVVGFSGRTLKDTDVVKIGKYINSTESAVFNKGRVLYGYDKAKEHIYKKKFVIIVEGNLDAPLLHQIGVKTAVATQGTALTEQHLVQLRKGSPKVILAYDGDKAGRAAAYKGAWLLSTHGIDGGVVLFPHGDDPASMIAEGRGEEVKRLLTSWTELIRFVIEETVKGYDLGSAHGKNDAVKACVAYLKALPSELVAQEYTARVASMVGVGMGHVTLGASAVPVPAVVQGVSSMEEVLLYSMYEDDGLVDVALNVCDDACWKDQVRYRALLERSATAEMFAGVMLREEVSVLGAKQFAEAVKVKQRGFLMAMKSQLMAGAGGFEEIQKINDRMKGL